MTPAVCIAATAYDSDAFRNLLKARGTRPVIHNNPTCKRFHRFDAKTCRQRNVIERTFSRLKDVRRHCLYRQLLVISPEPSAP